MEGGEWACPRRHEQKGCPANLTDARWNRLLSPYFARLIRSRPCVGLPCVHRRRLLSHEEGCRWRQLSRTFHHGACSLVNTVSGGGAGCGTRCPTGCWPRFAANPGGRQVRMRSRTISQADVGSDGRDREVRGGRGFTMLPRRWAVKRTFDRFGRYRVLSTKSAPMGEEIAVHRVRAAGWLRDRLFVKTEFST